jgi:beta-glucanase (GH16 family)
VSGFKKQNCMKAINSRNLIITAIVALSSLTVMGQKPYKGAEIYSNQSYKYGKYEMRMRVAKGSGILSTFFTYKNGSEISGNFWEELDIEVFGKNNATTFQSNIITNNPKKYSEQVHSPGYSMGDDYHTYVLEWTPDYVAWHIDGVEMRKSTGTQVSELTSAQSLRFNLWAANITSWVGSFDANSLPVYQFVNWIKYYSYTPGTGTNGSDFTLNWTDDFNTFNTSRWVKANWTFNENLTDFSPSNVLVKDGYLVLALTKSDQTGFTGVVPNDLENCTEKLIPSLTLNSSLGTTLSDGQLPLLETLTSNSGNNPAYVWKLNDTVISGAKSSTYQTTRKIKSGDKYEVTFSSNLACTSPQQLKSSLTFEVISGIEEKISDLENYFVDTNNEKIILSGYDRYEIYSTSGILVQKGSVEGKEIGVSSLSKGILYVLVVHNENFSKKTKFIK